MAQTGPPFNFSKLDKLLATITRTAQYEVVVGYPGETGAHEGSNISLATLAAIHDLGAPAAGIPARPFIRQSVINRKDRYVRTLAGELKLAFAGKQSVEAAFEKLALIAGAGVQQEITNPNPAFQALKPATIKRKGSSRPLIDSGQLRQAATGVVRRAGETK
ncbi:hypothetical protein AB3X94_37255 [Paraburkholderia sp. BR10923]|uniref:hypothetical protein n=1 Tax=Paraburkholderia sp. BR10923 TaxID=3236992 RepID=UPI0034CD0EE4